MTGRGRVLALLLLLAPLPAAAQPPARDARKDLTIADIFDPETRVDFGHPVTGLFWIDDAHYHWPRTDRRTRLTEHLRVDALSGRTEPLFDAGALRIRPAARGRGIGRAGAAPGPPEPRT